MHHLSRSETHPGLPRGLDGRIITLRENKSTHIPVHGIHHLANPSPEFFNVVVFQTGDYVKEKEIVRYEDIYARI